jgi:transcriptional regulator with XRE-family HTH domain
MQDTANTASPGDRIRRWRTLRRMSQLDLALEAGISQRHLSFIENGRSRPSRDMVLTLGRHLAMPKREQNQLLHAAGFAPVFGERPIGDPAMKAVREAVERVLLAHEPMPALAVDRHWTLVLANRPAMALAAQAADASLLEPPINVLRLSLHPGGLAPAILNLGEWKAHVLARLRGQIDASADDRLVALHDELESYPVPATTGTGNRPNAIYVPLRLASPYGPLSLISTTTVFGSPVDITVSELAIEAFYPADGSGIAAVDWFRALAAEDREL